MAQVSESGTELKKSSKKKAKNDTGAVSSFKSATEDLLKCLKHAAKGKLDTEEVESSLVSTSAWLEESLSSTAANHSESTTATPGSKSSKRKSRSVNLVPFSVTNGLSTLSSLWSQVVLIDFSSIPQQGRETLQLAGLASAAVAMGVSSPISPSEAFCAVNAASMALGVVAKLAEYSKSDGFSHDKRNNESSSYCSVLLSSAVPDFLSSLAQSAISLTSADLGLAAEVNGLLTKLKALMRAVALEVLYSDTSSSEGSKKGFGQYNGAVQALEMWGDGVMKKAVSLSNAILFEGVFGACHQALVLSSSYGGGGGARGDPQGITVGVISQQTRSSLPGPSSVSLAITLVSNFEAKCPSLAQFASTKKGDELQRFGALAACIAHVLSMRCLGDAEAVATLPSISLFMNRLSEDLPAVASTLPLVLQSDISGDIYTSPSLLSAVINLVSYLEAVCLVTCSMKPAVSSSHYASVLCLLLHVLRLLPIDSTSVDPKRRNIPLTAVFPAARAGSGSEARAAVLNALRTLLSAGNTHQLRPVLAFCEVTLASNSAIVNSQSAAGQIDIISEAYRLPITELALMALEACRGKAPMHTLSQHSERLAAAFTASITKTACPVVPQNSQDVGIHPLLTFESDSESKGASTVASYAALHAAFMSTLATFENEESSPAAVTAAVPVRSGTTGTAVTSSGNVPPSSIHWTLHSVPCASTEESVLAVASAVRALESIAARPKALPFSSRYIARALHCIDALFYAHRGIESHFSFPNSAVFVNLCHFLTALARHREGEIGRCLPLLGHAVRALLTALVKWEAEVPRGIHDGIHSSQAVGLHMAKSAVRVQCAEALAAVMSEIAALKVRQSFIHLIDNLLIYPYVFYYNRDIRLLS